MTLSPSLEKQIQADLFKFEANIVYKVSFGTVKGTKKKKPCNKKQKETIKQIVFQKHINTF